jgi:ACS family hexuronate transporter-like MFS transporter
LLVMAFWSLAAMGHALASSAMGFGMARFLLGLGESGNFPAAIKTVAEWFPKKERSFATGLFNSGANVGSILAPLIVPWVTIRYGWHMAFIATGAIGVLWMIWWFRSYRRPSEHPAVTERELRHIYQDAAEEVGPPIPWRRLLRYRQTWAFTLAKFLTDPIWYFYLFWMPGYFQEVRGLSIERVGRLLWIPYLAAGIGSVAGAWVSSAFIHRGTSVDRARKCVLIPSALLGSLGALSFFAADYAAAIAILAIALLGHQSWSSNLHTAISEISPREHVAVLYGMTGAAGTLAGAIGQLLIGPVVDAGGYALVFVGAGLIYILAAFLLIAAGKIEQIRPQTAVSRIST